MSSLQNLNPIMIINIIILINGHVVGTEPVFTLPQRYFMQMYSLTVLKTVRASWIITSYKRWPCWLTEHSRYSAVDLKYPLVLCVHYGADGLQKHLQLMVRNRESLSSDPRHPAAWLRQAGLYRSGQKASLATGGTTMVIRKQNTTKPEDVENRVLLTALKRMVTKKETQHG